MSRTEAASLTAVKLRRGPRLIEFPTKPGDITSQLAAPMPVPALAFAVEPPVVVDLLPPAPQPLLPAAAPLLAPAPTREARSTDRDSPPVRERAGYWDLVDYWDRLRRGSRLPVLAMLDRELVAGSWPDSLIVSYTADNRAMPQVARLSKPTGEIEYTPMVTDWIICCAREVARHGEAMEDEQEFPLARGTAGYRLLLLPFASAEASKSDHVLCHLTRAAAQRAARL
jgi:hypothetical protein